MRSKSLIGSSMATVLSFLGTGAEARPVPALSTPATVVQGQVDAFNQGNATAFASFYAENVEVFDLGPEAKPNLTGRQALLDRYEPMLRRYHPQAAILSRIETGDFVIDKERTLAGGKSSEGVAIYQIEKQKIRRVWFTP